MSKTSCCISLFTTSAKLDRAPSNSATTPLEAPFWGPNISEAPVGPHNGFVTSVAATISMLESPSTIPDVSMRSRSARAAPPEGKDLPRESKNLNPKAIAIPAPPSLVALPPRPTITRLNPFLDASKSNWPVPKVVVVLGFRRRGGTIANPEALAISITAVLPSPITPHWASICWWMGPVTVLVNISPPVASTKA